MRVEYPEREGYSNTLSWVKENPLNNPSYLEQACTQFPSLAEQFRALDREIEALAPHYNIAQIKIKFGGICYYVNLPEGTTPTVQQQVLQIIDTYTMSMVI